MGPASAAGGLGDWQCARLFFRAWKTSLSSFESLHVTPAALEIGHRSARASRGYRESITGSSGSKRTRRCETHASRIHLDEFGSASAVYKAWHKNRVALYIACIRAEAVVEPDLTRIHPNAVPVVKKQSHCTSVVIGWNVAKTAAVDMTAIVVPVVRATTGSKHPRKSDSSMIGPATRRGELGSRNGSREWLEWWHEQ